MAIPSIDQLAGRLQQNFQWSGDWGEEPQSPSSPPPDRLQLASASGVSIQEEAAMKREGVGLYEGVSSPSPSPSGAGRYGKDDRITKEYLERQVPEQNKTLEKILQSRRALEERLRGR